MQAIENKPETVSETTQLEAMGFGLASTMRSTATYPMLDFDIVLSYKGEEVIATKYSMGIGNLNIKTADLRRSLGVHSWMRSDEEEAMFRSCQAKPQANFRDKALQMRVAIKVAKAASFAPDVAAVLYSLMSDGEAFFNAQTFEQWASDYGYEEDSRKAEAIFKACDDTGRKLAQGIPADVLAQVREVLQGF